jgi:hypothetical protein
VKSLKTWHRIAHASADIQSEKWSPEIVRDIRRRSHPLLSKDVEYKEDCAVAANHNAAIDRAVAAQGGHKIRFVGEGHLSYCDRCHGGEIELETSCAERLAGQLAAAQADTKRFGKTLEYIRLQSDCWSNTGDNSSLRQAMRDFVNKINTVMTQELK